MLKSKANWNFNDDLVDDKSSIIDDLLKGQGIVTVEEKDSFLHPNLDHIQSPTNFNQINKAKNRVMEAIRNGEEIIVYGDYDADGVTSTALLMTALTELGAMCDFYIPNRFHEGYGLNEEAIKRFHNQGVTVIITVDNGIANIVEADSAKMLGIDLIITDHHEMQEQIPDAYAIIHPKLSEEYTFKDLAGVGVAFQFAHHLLDYMPTHLLDLVAIGTVADLVPLQNENRVFVHYGVKQLSKTTNMGIQALIKECKFSDVLTEKDIGFGLAPRLNAVGRLQDANLAVDLLLTEDAQEAAQIARHIENLNEERREIVKEMVKKAEKQVNKEDSIIILYDENWHEGVLGIAASRLVSQFNRPVIMLAHKKATNELKGSARSIPAFDLFENCMEINEYFINFGGHSQAAGMTFSFENLEIIKSSLNDKVLGQLTADEFRQEINISRSLSISKVTEELVQQVNMLAPFGMKNEEPIFHISASPTQIRQIGQDKNHLKMQFKVDNKVIDAIGFGMGHLFYFLSEHVAISLVGKLQINEWNGNRTVQMLIEDIAVKEWQLFDFRGKKNFKNILPYISHYEKNVVVVNNNEQINDFSDYANVKVITYESDVSMLTKSDILYLYDLPYDLDVLREVISKTDPTCIHVSYTVTEDAFLQSLPSREDFRWMYGYLFKHSPIHLKVDLPKVMQMKRWTKEKSIFILKVFLDLQFITVQDDVIYVNKDAKKTELNKSRTYQLRIQQSEIEKTLYYSNYEELKQWLEQSLKLNSKDKVEVPHEL